MSRYGGEALPVPKEPVSRTLHVQTESQEIPQVKRLGKRSAQLLSRLDTLVDKLRAVREQSLSSFEDYTIDRVADIYSNYERRVAFSQDRHAKRLIAMDEHYQAQLAEYLNRATGDWVLTFMGDYEKDINDIKQTFIPAIKRAEDLVTQLEATARANDEVIRKLSQRALKLENEATSKGYDVAELDVGGVQGEMTDADIAAAADRRKAVQSMLALAQTASPQQGFDDETSKAQKSTALEMDAVMINAAMSEDQKEMLRTRAGAARFNASRPPPVNVRAELGRFIDYCRAKQELMIDNMTARHRDEVETVARQCYESMIFTEERLRNYQKGIVDNMKRALEDEKKLVTDSDKLQMLAEIKSRRRKAAISRLKAEQKVLQRLVPRTERTDPRAAHADGDSDDSSDNASLMSYRSGISTLRQQSLVGGHSRQRTGSVSSVIRSLRRQVSRKGFGGPGSVASTNAPDDLSDTLSVGAVRTERSAKYLEGYRSPSSVQGGGTFSVGRTASFRRLGGGSPHGSRSSRTSFVHVNDHSDDYSDDHGSGHIVDNASSSSRVPEPTMVHRRASMQSEADSLDHSGGHDDTGFVVL